MLKTNRAGEICKTISLKERQSKKREGQEENRMLGENLIRRTDFTNICLFSV